jgi:HPt (histidine-containing phosphotransfer) domain-containing protein
MFSDFTITGRETAAMHDDQDSKTGDTITVTIDRDLKDLIPGYLQNRENDLKTMIQKCAQGDFESIRIMAHNIKGTGGGYGFDRITDIGSRIEEAAKAKNQEDLYRGIDEIAAFLQKVRIVYE